ncbi:hypothetical protein [Phytohabitans houttuyneae]|jgi:outer membrane murein-binding lipoprotein Lpp|uniref:Uncharacterized protein n=1 Tax=Phytohabitans houttuyneae TaxID=1076126 RepID=A0A6V8K4W6_9ACTN|nr:hypothetical protein [Phytohabitans houttuyneae]GFJ78570.1 hypothetical protein Phou_027500 [Phytohabitans houttuyneae]
MTHPGYPPEDPQQQYPPQSPAYPGYPPPPQPTGSWPATSTPPYAVSGAPPATGVAYGQQQQQPGRAPMLVAVVAAVALFLLAGVMTGLYVAKSSQLGDTRDTLSSQVSDRDETIKANNDKITQLESDLTKAKDESTKNKESLDKVTKERDVLLPCMRRFVEALDAAGSNNEAALDTALRQATTACQKAQGEVDS